MKNSTTKQMRYLGRLARSGKSTPEQDTELARLEAAFYSLTPRADTVYDLPVARRMWANDARHTEKE